MLGPTGIGALLARPDMLEAMEPFLTGGDMIRDVTLDGATWNEIPHKFEAGTPMIAEVPGSARRWGARRDSGWTPSARTSATWPWR
jgi:selenocysteine lyase/cysteine desulfurase